MKPSEAVRDIAYEITCPICQVGPQEACVTTFHRVPKTEPHEVRKWLARDVGLRHAD